jgi:hypothetical protein
MVWGIITSVFFGSGNEQKIRPFYPPIPQYRESKRMEK